MSTNSSYPATLAQIVSSITLYTDYVTVIFGTIGGICNLITFTSRQMRQSSAVLYLLCATMFQLLTILYCVIMRLAYDRSGSNLQNQSAVFCKLRYYLVVTLPALASYYMFLTTLDRYLCTSDNARVRSWCQTKTARRLAAATMIVGFVMSIHVLILYDIYNNMCQISPGSAYTLVFAGYWVIVVTLLPDVLTVIFSLAIVLAVRKSRQRGIPTMTGNQIPNRRRAQHLELKFIQIIVLQVILGMLLALLRLGSYSYNIITNSFFNPTTDQRAAVSFATTLGGSLYFFSFATPFYGSMISSKFFRNGFYQRILFFYHHCVRQLAQRNP